MAGQVLGSDEIKRRFEHALKAFVSAERDLIKRDPSERSLTHRLASYLESEFPGWCVDCEYNRLGERPKEIVVKAPTWVATDSVDAVTVFPDIIVHRRGTAGPNLLVIEAKKATSTASTDFDHVKLRAYRKQLHYRCAAFVVLPAGRCLGRAPEWI